MKRLRPVLLVLVSFVLLYPCSASAAILTPRSDTLSTSAISTAASHDIVFRTITGIPVSGKLIFTPEPGIFTIPAALYHRDLDLLINGVNQKLDTAPGNGITSPHGVSVTTGVNGSIVITLNDTTSIGSGSTVEIKIGQNASFEAAGVLGIINASTVGSHLVNIRTADNNGVELDTGDMGLSMTVPIGVTADVTSTTVATPSISPTGGTFGGSVVVSITTATSGASVYYTTDGASPTPASILYTGSITLTQNTTLQAIAVKSGMQDSAIASATFAITTGSGGGSGGGGGAIVPYLPPIYIPPVGSTRISGDTGGLVIGQCDNGAHISLQIPPGSWPGDGIVELACIPWSTFEPKTGAPAGNALADTIFGVSVSDADGRPINTSLKPIIVNIAYTSGHRSAYTEPFAAINFNPQFFWKNIGGFTNQPTPEQFRLSITRLESIAILGQSKKLDCSDRPGDLNCDGRVNITDLSILLYYWNSRDRGIKADINKDGIVNLIDFSILLYWWTN